MKSLLHAIGWLAFSSVGAVWGSSSGNSNAKASEALIRVQVRVQTTGVWCGGAALTPAQMASVARPMPTANKRLLIRRGPVNSRSEPLAQVVSDREGRFSVSLPEGTYCVIDDAKRESRVKSAPRSTQWDKPDLACLQQEVRRCDAVFSLPNDAGREVLVTFSGSCPWSRPCFRYSGPLPPSATHGPPVPRR